MYQTPTQSAFNSCHSALQLRCLGLASGQFLLLGSATGVLLQQSSESMAGRVAYVELRALQVPEVFAERATAIDCQ